MNSRDKDSIHFDDDSVNNGVIVSKFFVKLVFVILMTISNNAVINGVGIHFDSVNKALVFCKFCV